MDAATAESTFDPRTGELFDQHRVRVTTGANRAFVILMLAQWAFAIFIAAVWSPYTWSGKAQSVNVHVPAAFLLGGAISSLPLFMLIRHPHLTLTRHVVAAGQMLWSALLIHLTGGRIETHFHVFGSLAFLSFYRDWRILLTATVVIATDHLARGMYWPESVYGIQNPEWWRFLEHAGWVVFEDSVLAFACFRGVSEMMDLSARQSETESLTRKEQEKSAALDQALTELRKSQETLVRTEKLAAVGQLAASVGHELRNPLGAIRGAMSYVTKRLSDPQAAASDPKVKQFVEIMERELNACSRIISDLLDFARERPPNLTPCPLRPLVDEALSIVPARAGVTLENEVPESLPVPLLDKEQFRQVIVNLVQNASEAIPAGRGGTVEVRAEGGGDRPFSIEIADDGAGIPPDLVEKIFQPLFTTKTKGTGLGLAIVSSMVTRHQGTLRVESEVGKGTRILIEIPSQPLEKAA